MVAAAPGGVNGGVVSALGRYSSGLCTGIDLRRVEGRMIYVQ